jgi:type VI secretion system protein ImpC
MAEALEQQSALKDVAYQGSDFSSLLQKEFKPRSDEAKSAVEAAVLTLAQQALANTQVVGKDVTKSIQAMIAAIDKKLTDQVNAILHTKTSRSSKAPGAACTTW